MPHLSLTLLDHIFVLVILSLVLPIAGWKSFERFQARKKKSGGKHLVREYQRTILWFLFLAGVTLAVWIGNSRPVESLFAFWNLSQYRELAVIGCIVIGTLVVIRPFVAIFSPEMSSQMADTLRDLGDFLPRTRYQLLWGVGVSIAAGIGEELVYRGYLLPYFESIMPMSAAMFVSSVIFGLAHLYQGVSGVITSALIGFLFSLLYLTTGTLLWPILLHALMDISAITAAYIVLSSRFSQKSRQVATA